MKCLKNLKTGTIIRIDDFKANNMVGKEWAFTSKEEWKKTINKPEPIVETKVEETTISEKQLKRKKK
jgi:hypothetical protein